MSQFFKRRPRPAWNVIKFQNIFPLAKVSFAKGKMLGAGRQPTGPEWREFGHFW